MEKIHILLCGERGAGKTTLIEKLLEECEVPVRGFVTRSTPRREDGFHSIYIHPAGSAERVRTEENHIGDCNGRQRTVNLQVFETKGISYLQATEAGVIVMDELGFMETGSEKFCRTVFDCLDGDIPVLAALKSRFDVDFLNQVRAHTKAQVYMLTEENRDLLYHELKPVVQKWNIRKSGGADVKAH